MTLPVASSTRTSQEGKKITTIIAYHTGPSEDVKQSAQRHPCPISDEKDKFFGTGMVVERARKHGRLNESSSGLPSLAVEIQSKKEAQ